MSRRNITYRHALPPPRGAGEEAGGRVEWGLHAFLWDGDRGGGHTPLPVSPAPAWRYLHAPVYRTSLRRTALKGMHYFCIRRHDFH